ncbi:MAG: M20/M25/M40 family metallo-hydrolase [Candidatus Thalassarchaeaceae archaeon]|nr:M20/M25/M40 family metallo-hydrolase [Candidatus Thalassarchaeaceae archaeon]
MSVDLDRLIERADELWEDSIIPSLSEFIGIEALSPGFEPDWELKGELNSAIELFSSWLVDQELDGMTYKIHQIEGRTPVLLVTVEGTGPGEVIFYSHLDKQPSREHLWSEGLHPLKAVRRDPWLFGRGALDDGYGGYVCVTALKMLQEQGVPYPRSHFLIETCEESGSYDLPPYLDELTQELGNPNLIVVLDSGGPDYEHIWVTEALRGLVAGTLSVQVSNEGVHSGMSGGVIPSSFRIQRILLDRVEDSNSGEILIPEMHVEISDKVRKEAEDLGGLLGDELWSQLPVVDNLKPQNEGAAEILLDMNWRPAMSVIGADGLPPTQTAGNVLRTNTDLKLSFRIPPGVSAEKIDLILKEKFEQNPPYGATVEYIPDAAADGFHAPAMDGKLAEALNEASMHISGLPPMATWVGGTIPFMAMMQEKYPKAQFLCTGTGGPGNNAHGPDEKMHIPSSKRLTAVLSATIAAVSQ